MNSTCRTESPWISLPWCPESWNSSMELWILVVSWLPAAFPGFDLERSQGLGFWAHSLCCLSSHWIVALEKFLWQWLNTTQSLPGEQHCQPHPWAGGHRALGVRGATGVPWHQPGDKGTRGSSAEWGQWGQVLPGPWCVVTVTCGWGGRSSGGRARHGRRSSPATSWDQGSPGPQ